MCLSFYQYCLAHTLVFHYLLIQNIFQRSMEKISSYFSWFLNFTSQNVEQSLSRLEIRADDQFFLEIIALLSSISFDDLMKIIQVTCSFSFYKSCCERSYLSTFKSILLLKSQYISSRSSQYDSLVPVQVPPPCGDLALVIPCL